MVFQDKVALITGASRGIGFGIARHLAAKGMTVVGCGREGVTIEKAMAQIRGEGGAATGYECNVADEKQVDALFAAILQAHGRLDALVNNAGIFVGGPIEAYAVEDWDNMMAVNVRGVYLCCRSAFRVMKPRGGGSIINIASLSGVRGAEKFPGTGAYAASKAGVLGLTEVLAVEGKPFNIRVNAISPGAVDTEMLRKAAPHLNPGVGPAEVAGVVALLLDEAAQPLNAVNIEIFSNA